jgi:tRNA-specific 2-thiouridylase
VGLREELRCEAVDVRGVVLRREAGRVNAVKLRYRSQPLNGGIEEELAEGAHPRARLVLDEPVLGAAPGQTAVLLDGDLVVGHATIAA